MQYTRIRWRMLASVAAMLFCLAPVAEPSGSIQVDGVAAHVDQRTITIGEVLDLMAPAAAQMREHYRGEALEAQLESASRQALRHLIDRALILGAYETGKAAIPDRLLQNRIREITFDRFGRDREAVWDKLAGAGLTLEEWQSQLRESIIVSFLRDTEIESRIQVSPGAVRAAYVASPERFQSPATVLLRVIMIRDQSGGDASHRDLAVSLVERLKRGEAFDALASEYSEGRQADAGGNWGWVNVNELQPALAEQALNLPVGSVSEAITIDPNHYIIQIDGRRHASVTPLAEAYRELHRELQQQEAEKLYISWVERLESLAAVQMLENFF